MGALSSISVLIAPAFGRSGAEDPGRVVEVIGSLDRRLEHRSSSGRSGQHELAELDRPWIAVAATEPADRQPGQKLDQGGGVVVSLTKPGHDPSLDQRCGRDRNDRRVVSQLERPGEPSEVAAEPVSVPAAGESAIDEHDADITADLATAGGRAQVVEEVGDAVDGAIDAVVACAGTVGQGATDVRVNFFGAVATLEGLRPLLTRGTDPRAVAVTSYAVLEEVDDTTVGACLAGDEAAAIARATSLAGVDPMKVYASSKRALARWLRRVAPAVEWAGAGIALNSVGPGVVRTPMTAPLLQDDGLAEVLLATVPMPLGGVMAPEQVAQLIVTLTDPALKGLTGQTIFLDGGADCVRRGEDIWTGK